MSSSKDERDTPSPQRVPLTEAVLLEIREQIERTGLGPQALLSKIENPPDGLNRSLIAAWMGRRLKTARKNLLEFVLDQWKALPDCNLIDLTPEIVAALNSEKERTGIGEVALLRGLRPSEHNGLGSGRVRQWLVGTAQRADKTHVELVMARWKALPDYDDEWVTLTKQKKQKIKALKKRAQISWERFFRECDDLPDGLSLGLFNVVFNGSRRPIRTHHYKYIVDALTALANEVDSGTAIFATPLRKGYVALTDEMRDTLKSERDRTGVAVKSIISILAMSGGSLGLKPSTISYWMNGQTKSVPETLYNEVIAAWRSLPDKNAFWNN